jgi:hypothetical protein
MNKSLWVVALLLAGICRIASAAQGEDEAVIRDLQNRQANAWNAHDAAAYARLFTSIRFLTPTIAIAHVRWTMTGAHTPPGMPEPREGIEIQTLRMTAGHWLIESFQNTNAIPERPFPSGPPGGAPGH